MDNRHNYILKFEGLLRYVMVNTLSNSLPLYIVAEYPKSGGSWLSQMLSDYLRIDFPRNRFPSLIPSLMQEHVLYTTFMNNVFCIHRDGRDIIVSLYYYTLFQNELNSPYLVRQTRKDLPFEDYDDIKNNLSDFIKYIYKKDKKSWSPLKFTWTEFVDSWENKKVAFLKYEDLLNNGLQVLSDSLEKVTNEKVDKVRLGKIFEKYSFKNQAKRNNGEEKKDSFLRKGKSGDWIEKFSYEAGITFNSLAGDTLIKLGYEKDRSWLDKLKNK